MESTARTLTLAPSWRKLVTFALLAVITLAPLTMAHTQFITGPLVNATLLLTAVLVGPLEALLLSLFPSPVALMSGLLPLPMAPMLPFIMIGNALFVVTFHMLRTRGDWLAMAAGAFVKFAFLALSVRIVMPGMLSSPLLGNLTVMMTWPQLITALAGGAIALGVLRVSKIRALR